MRNKLLCLFFILIIFGCAHHKDVRPGADGVNKVLIVDDQDQEEQGSNAMSQANHYCKELKMHPVVVSEERTYVGKNVDEATYNKGKMATRAAKSVGDGLWMIGANTGDQKQSKKGEVVGLGGEAVDAALGKGYQYEMKFKCQ